MLKCMKVEEMKEGYLYAIHARNAEYGIWKPDEYGFLIRRTKFQDVFTFVELHWDVSSDFGTARPKMELELSPFTLVDMNDRTREKEMLKWLYERANYWNARI